MNPFDPSDQDLPESFASAFARPSELLAPDEDLTTFTWPVALVSTAAAVGEVAPDLNIDDRDELVARLDDIASEWIRRSDWDALAPLAPEANWRSGPEAMIAGPG